MCPALGLTPEWVRLWTATRMGHKADKLPLDFKILPRLGHRAAQHIMMCPVFSRTPTPHNIFQVFLPVLMTCIMHENAS